MTGFPVATAMPGTDRPVGTLAAAALAGVLLALGLLIWPPRPRGLPVGFDAKLAGRSARGGRGRWVWGRLRYLLPHGHRWAGRGHRLEDGLTEILDSLGPALEAGLPLHACLASVLRSTTADHPGRVMLQDLHSHEVSGEPLGPVWRRHARTASSPQLALVAQAWALTERTGAPLAAAVASTGRLLRDALAARRRVDSATAQARITVRMLAAMPLSGPLLAWAVGVDPGSLLSSPYSRWSVGAGVAVFLLGRYWVTRQIAAALRPRAPA